MSMRALSALAVCCLLLGIACNDFENDNAYDPSYEGDYSLALDTALFDDTLEVLTSYRVSFTDGSDAFAYLTAPAAVDSALLNLSYAGDTELELFFVDTVDGTITIGGMPSNEVVEPDMEQAVAVVVVNPYIVDGPQMAGVGDTVAYRVVRADSAPLAAGLRVVWDSRDTLAATDRYRFAATTDRNIGAAVLAPNGRSCALSPLTLSLPGTTPVVGAVVWPDTLCQGDRVLVVLTVTGNGRYSVVLRAGEQVLNDSTVTYAYGSEQPVRAVQAVADTGAVTLTVVVTDERSGLRAEVASAPLTVSYRVPSVWFSDSLREVPLHRPSVVSVLGEAAAYRWTSSSRGLDTLTDSGWIELVVTSEQPETLLVRGVNPWGVAGAADTLVLRGRVFRYSLAPLSFPTTAQAAREVVYAVAVREGGSEVDGATYRWQVTPEQALDSVVIDSGRLVLYSPDSVSFTLRVRGFVGADSTEEIVRAVSIQRFAPYLSFEQPSYSGAINVPFSVGVEARDPNADGAVEQIRYRLQPPAPDEREVSVGPESSWAMTLSAPGTFTLEAWAIDNDGFESPRATTQLQITAGSPYFSPASLDTTVYVYDTLVVSVSAHGGAAGQTVTAIRWYVDDSLAHAGLERSLTTVFTEAGAHEIAAEAINDAGDTSRVPFTAAITVDAGTPVLDAFAVDSPRIYMGEALTFSLRAHDVNGELATVELAPEGVGGDTRAYTHLGRDTLDTVMTVTYPIEGVYTPAVRLTDADGVRGTWIEGPVITVERGTPVVSGIGLDTVWVGDAVALTVSARDNGTVESCRLSDGGSGYVSYDTLTIDTAFTVAGWNRVEVVVLDNEGNESATYRDSVFVRLGAPVVTGLTPDTVWVNDRAVYRVAAHDTNGTIASYRFQFGALNQWAHSDSAAIAYAWDTARGGRQQVVVQAMDDDSVWGSDTFTVLVRLGRPVLRGKTFGDSIQWVPAVGGGLDTIYYVNHENINTTVQVMPHDSNGTCELYFWDWGANGTINATTTTTTTTDGFEEDEGRELIVYCQDDDSLRSNQIHAYVYHDGPPPTTTTTTSQPGMPDVQLAWQGLDVKDDSLTQFAVVVGTSARSVTDTVLSFTAANDDSLGSNGNWITYTWNPQQYGITGDFFYRVVARDARGSLPDTINTSSVMYPY